MEKFDIDYSLKNIPISSNESYLIKLIKNIESVGKRMGWTASFFPQEKHKSDIWREDLRFKSKNTLPQCKHMEAFKKKCLDVIPNIKLRSVKNTFQKELKEDIPKIKQSRNALSLQTKQVISMKCPNNKTKNFFMTKPQKHMKKHQLN